MKFSEFKKKIDEELSASSDSSEKAKNLEIILDIVKSINHTLILEDVLQLVLNNAIKLTRSERGFIVLKNSTGKLEFKLGLDSNGKTLPEELFNISTSVVKNVFDTGQSKFIEDAQSDTNFDPSKSILSLDLRTILCSPLITEEKKIGVIYVDNKHLEKINVREITDTFEILAGQAATAIRNAQLYAGQLNAFNALQEANSQLIQAERKALKSSIDSEIGQSLQGLVHLALLENESMMRSIEILQKNPRFKARQPDRRPDEGARPRSPAGRRDDHSGPPADPPIRHRRADRPGRAVPRFARRRPDHRHDDLGRWRLDGAVRR